MALHVYGASFSTAWQKLLTELLANGEETSPRGSKTREILNVTFEVSHGLRNILINGVRDLNYRFMIAEWLWIHAGLNDVATLAQYNSVMRQFSDDNIILSGAYGPRLDPQWNYIVRTLSKPDSRQAVSVIWIANPQDSKDIPCTLTLQWFVRNLQGQGTKLHCTVNMRSSDVWLGLPYDFFTFSQLTNSLASALQLPVGSITMNLGSSHIYEPHFDIGAEASIANTFSLESPAIPLDFPPGQEEIREILQKKIPHPHYEDSVWGKYAHALAKDKRNALEILYDMDPSRQA